MEAEQTTPPPYVTGPNPPDPPKPGGGNGVKKAAGPLAVLGALLLKFKVAILAAIKLFPFLAKFGLTTVSMALSIFVYARFWGISFAVGFVLLIFVHECGHLIAARLLGLRVSAPMFIPFFGALILLKEAPRNAWIEAQVGIAGPLLGTVGGVVCMGLYYVTGNELFLDLAASCFLINLFNLTPFGFLDGGRVVTALSPWLWLVGVVIFGLLMLIQFNPILLLIVILSLPRLFSLFRKKSPEQARYYEVTPMQRCIMAGLYFGLIAFLVIGMMITGVRQRPHSKQIAQGSSKLAIKESWN